MYYEIFRRSVLLFLYPEFDPEEEYMDEEPVSEETAVNTVALDLADRMLLFLLAAPTPPPPPPLAAE